jgi:cytochrome c-type biogenesis protein CcmH
VSSVRRWLPWAVLIAVAAVVLAIGLQSGGSKPSLDSQVNHIGSELKCPVCNGETVAQSQASEAVQIRAEIRQELVQGESTDQIIAGLVDSFGPGILEKPPAHGVSLLVWVLPVAGVILGAAGLLLAFRRWRRPEVGGSEGPEPSSPSPPIETASRETPSVDMPSIGTPALEAPSLGERSVEEPLVGTSSLDRSGGESQVRVGDTAPTVVAHAALSDAPGQARRGGRPRRLGKVLIGAAGGALVVGGATWALAASTGHRLPGEEISGQALGADQVNADLLAAQADEQKNDVVGAMHYYQNVLTAQPNQIEALAGEGWLLAQTQQPVLLQRGLTLLQKAETVQPTYGPAHVYRGAALYLEGDYSGSIPELQWYLNHDPDPQLVKWVNTTLAEAKSKASQSGGA